MAAISQVWWPSCPHEWAFPFLEAHSHPDFSSIGRASISALRATVAPGLLPSIKRNPLPGEVSVSNPEIPNCSRMDLMRASVPRVLKPTSGFRGRFCGRRSNEIRIVEAPDECFLDLLCFSFSAEIALLNKASFSEGRGR